ALIASSCSDQTSSRGSTKKASSASTGSLPSTANMMVPAISASARARSGDRKPNSFETCRRLSSSMRMRRLRMGLGFMQATHQQPDRLARQFADRVGRRQPPFRDHGDVGGHLEYLIEILADDQNGRSGAGKIDERLADAARRAGIDAPGRLVDDKDRGLP